MDHVSDDMHALRLRNAELEALVAQYELELLTLAGGSEEEMRRLERAERILRENEEKYRALLDDSRDGIVITTRDGEFVDVNLAFVDLVGCASKNEVLGKKIQDFYANPGDRRRMRVLLDKRGATTDYEMAFRRIDGSKIDTLHTISVKTDANGEIIGYQGIMRDITDRKRADEELRKARDELEIRVSERTAELAKANTKLRSEIAERARAQMALKQSEERFRAIFETARDCIFIKDRSLRYTLVNPYMENLLGKPVSQVIGMTDEDLFGRSVGAHLREVDSRVLDGDIIEEEHTRPVRDTELTFLDIRSPMRDSTGHVVGICGISRNITERKATQPVVRYKPDHYPAIAMRSALEAAMLAARTDSIILLTGESGTGKDRLAGYVHNNSSRAGGPFYTMNCAAIAPDLAESELFGHEPGAFTGANRRKRGRFELAEGGTLLLNEIGELPLPLQAKLLTFLDTRSFTRVGGENRIRVNARLIAATNRDLEKEVSENRFRQDLFYRLNVFSIRVPRLRDRTDDIPVLVREILTQLSSEMQLPSVPDVGSSAMRRLKEYSWPGNVRELRNVLERGLILSRGGPLTLDHLGLVGKAKDERSVTVGFPQGRSLIELLEEIERTFLEEALERAGGTKQEAARLLGVSRYVLKRHMRKLGVRYRPTP